MDLVSCWHLATSPHPHHRQCPPLPSNGGNIALHAVSNPVWTSPQCRRMPLPWLVEEACGHVADGHKISSAMLKRTPQLDSKIGYMSCAGSQAVRARATWTLVRIQPEDLYCMSHTLSLPPFLSIHCQIKVPKPKKKSLKQWGVWWQVEYNKSITVDEPVQDQSSPMETDIIPEDNKLGLL